uniref:Uncharacterized protein n=1 Tax=Oryza punctata TaxID=4537 RepID=A0A0E0JJ67_ORYPU
MAWRTGGCAGRCLLPLVLLAASLLDWSLISLVNMIFFFAIRFVAPRRAQITFHLLWCIEGEGWIVAHSWWAKLVGFARWWRLLEIYSVFIILLLYVYQLPVKFPYVVLAFADFIGLFKISSNSEWPEVSSGISLLFYYFMLSSAKQDIQDMDSLMSLENDSLAEELLPSRNVFLVRQSRRHANVLLRGSVFRTFSINFFTYGFPSIMDMMIWETIGLWHYSIPGLFLLAQFCLGVFVALCNLVNNSVFLYTTTEGGASSSDDHLIDEKEDTMVLIVATLAWGLRKLSRAITLMLLFLLVVKPGFIHAVYSLSNKSTTKDFMEIGSIVCFCAVHSHGFKMLFALSAVLRHTPCTPIGFTILKAGLNKSVLLSVYNSQNSRNGQADRSTHEKKIASYLSKIGQKFLWVYRSYGTYVAFLTILLTLYLVTPNYISFGYLFFLLVWIIGRQLVEKTKRRLWFPLKVYATVVFIFTYCLSVSPLFAGLVSKFVKLYPDLGFDPKASLLMNVWQSLAVLVVMQLYSYERRQNSDKNFGVSDASESGLLGFLRRLLIWHSEKILSVTVFYACLSSISLSGLIYLLGLIMFSILPKVSRIPSKVYLVYTGLLATSEYLFQMLCEPAQMCPGQQFHGLSVFLGLKHYDSGFWGVEYGLRGKVLVIVACTIQYNVFHWLDLMPTSLVHEGKWEEPCQLFISGDTSSSARGNNKESHSSNRFSSLFSKVQGLIHSSSSSSMSSGSTCQTSEPVQNETSGSDEGKRYSFSKIWGMSKESHKWDKRKIISLKRERFETQKTTFKNCGLFLLFSLLRSYYSSTLLFGRKECPGYIVSMTLKSIVVNAGKIQGFSLHIAHNVGWLRSDRFSGFSDSDTYHQMMSQRKNALVWRDLSLETKSFWTFLDYIRLYAYCHLLDIVLALIAITGTLEYDVLHLGYLGFALVFFRMRLEILKKKNKIFKYLRMYNFALIVLSLAYQSPYFGQFSSGKCDQIDYIYEIIGFYKYDYGFKITSRSAFVEIVIFLLVSIQSYIFSSGEFDYVSRYLEAEQIGAMVREQEKKALKKTEQLQHLRRSEEQKRERNMQVERMKSEMYNLQSQLNRMNSFTPINNASHSEGLRHRRNTKLYTDNDTPLQDSGIGSPRKEDKTGSTDSSQSFEFSVEDTQKSLTDLMFRTPCDTPRSPIRGTSEEFKVTDNAWNSLGSTSEITELEENEGKVNPNLLKLQNGRGAVKENPLKSAVQLIGDGVSQVQSFGNQAVTNIVSFLNIDPEEPHSSDHPAEGDIYDMVESQRETHDGQLLRTHSVTSGNGTKSSANMPIGVIFRLLSMVYLGALFLYALCVNYGPSYLFWVIVLIYTELNILSQYIYQIVIQHCGLNIHIPLLQRFGFPDDKIKASFVVSILPLFLVYISTLLQSSITAKDGEWVPVTEFSFLSARNNVEEKQRMPYNWRERLKNIHLPVMNLIRMIGRGISRYWLSLTQGAESPPYFVQVTMEVNHWPEDGIQPERIESAINRVLAIAHEERCQANSPSSCHSCSRVRIQSIERSKENSSMALAVLEVVYAAPLDCQSAGWYKSLTPAADVEKEIHESQKAGLFEDVNFPYPVVSVIGGGKREIDLYAYYFGADLAVFFLVAMFYQSVLKNKSEFLEVYQLEDQFPKEFVFILMIRYGIPNKSNLYRQFLTSKVTQLEDIYASLFLVKCDAILNRANHQQGEKQTKMTKFCSGICLFFIYSSGNPTNIANPIIDVSVKIDIKALGGRLTFFKTTVCEKIPWKHMRAYDDVDPLDYLGAYNVEDIQLICCQPDASTMWLIPAPVQSRFIQSLEETEMIFGNMELILNWDFLRARPKGKELVKYESPVDRSPSVDDVKRVLNGTTNSFRITDAYPRYFRVTGSGEVRRLEASIDSVSGELLLNNGTAPWWSFYDTNPSDLAGCQGLNGPMAIVVSEETPQGIIGETLSKFSIWSLYITFVLAVARFIRLQCSDLRMRIPYENLPSCDRLLDICEGIYAARAEGELEVEEVLYWTLNINGLFEKLEIVAGPLSIQTNKIVHFLGYVTIQSQFARQNLGYLGSWIRVSWRF